MDTTVSEAEADPDRDLPALREDLRLMPGPRDHRGHPTWTLHDPVRNRFFQLDEHTFQIVACWSRGTPAGIVEAVSSQYPWHPTVEDVENVCSSLTEGELLDCGKMPTLRTRLQRVASSRNASLGKKLLHNYLFFRIPLIHPDTLLDRLYPRVRFLFTSAFIGLSALVGVISLFLLARQWDSFVNAMPWFFTAEGALVLLCTLAGVKLMHEMGHALTCKHYGLRVPSMGVAFMVMWPVLYTDASDGWRLTSRRQRALISSAGVITELVLACYALLAWVMLPEDGILRSIALTVATTTLLLSLAINLNPLMRFDGYYFTSDIVNVPNLQDRSFVVGRWQLRTWLFGDVGPAPGDYDRQLRIFLTTYAFATWIYRFILFLGIAVLVYYFFFKALGIFLFMVEIWYFIARPIRNEMKQWPTLWGSMGETRKRRWMLIGGAAFLFLLYPWQQTFQAPAQWVDARFVRIFPARPAMVESIETRNGEQVVAGQVLLRLSSPALDNEMRQAGHNIDALRSMLERSVGSEEMVEERLISEQAYARAQAELLALEQIAAQLTVTAAMDGVVEDLMADLHAGRWVSQTTHLLTVREARRARVTAWVREDKTAGIEVGDEATFYGEATGSPQGMAMRIVAMERSAVTELESAYPASTYGGPIPVTTSDGRHLVPEIAVYRVHLQPLGTIDPEELPVARLRGEVRFEGNRYTLVGRLFRLVAGTVLRESAF